MHLTPDVCLRVARSPKPDASSSPRDRELAAGLALVTTVVKQLEGSVGRVLPHDDMVSLGNLGLIDAMARFDGARGVAFRGYAAIRIRGAIIDGMRNESLMPRTEYKWVSSAAEVAITCQPARTNTSEASFDEARDPESGDPAELLDASPSPEELVARAQQAQALRQVIDGLSPLDAELVRRHYQDGETLQRISEDLGFGPRWGSRALPAVEAILRRRLSGYDVEPAAA